MIRLSDLTPAQRDAFLTHLASHDPVREELRHDGAFLELTMSVGQLQELASADLHSAAAGSGLAAASSGTFPASHSAGSDASGGLHQREGSGGMTSSRRVSTTSTTTAASSMTLNMLTKTIDDFYAFRARLFAKEEEDSRRSHQHRSTDFPVVDDVTVRLFAFLTERYGIESLVKKQSLYMVNAVKHYRSLDLSVQLFGVLLGSAAYDTIDVAFLIRCRSRLKPLSSVHETPACDSPIGEPLRRSYVLVRNIPAICSKVLRDYPDVLMRVQLAFNKWFDVAGRFPQLVADPNFYTPPFADTHPYVVSFRVPSAIDLMSAVSSVDERFAAFAGDPLKPRVVDATQLLVLWLLNFKHLRHNGQPVARSNSAVHGGGGRGSPSPSRRFRSASRSSSAAVAAGVVGGPSTFLAPTASFRMKTGASHQHSLEEDKTSPSPLRHNGHTTGAPLQSSPMSRGGEAGLGASTPAAHATKSALKPRIVDATDVDPKWLLTQQGRTILQDLATPLQIHVADSPQSPSSSPSPLRRALSSAARPRGVSFADRPIGSAAGGGGSPSRGGSYRAAFSSGGGVREGKIEKVSDVPIDSTSYQLLEALAASNGPIDTRTAASRTGVATSAPSRGIGTVSV